MPTPTVSPPVPPKPVPPQTRKPLLHRQETTVQVRAPGDGEPLPPGVCGRIIVTALTFNEIDTYGTQFAPGCADRSIAQRVAAGRLPLLLNHDNEVGKHVGVVRAMPTVGNAYLGECDVLDTEDGRRFLEYAKACLAAGAVTGASIRFVPRLGETVKLPDGKVSERFTEIELRELTVVPLSAVPRTDLLAARADAADGGDGDAGLDAGREDATLLETAARVALEAMSPEARAALLQSYTETAGPGPARADAATPPAPTVPMATDEERLAAVRLLA